MVSSISDIPILTFGLGAISSYSILMYRLYLTERSSQLNDHLKDIERLVESALSTLGVESDVSKEKLIKLSWHHSVASRTYPRIREICHSRDEEYEKFMLRLFALVTADHEDKLLDEASKNVDRLELRAQEIVATSSDLTNLLRDVRRESLSPSNLIRDFSIYLKAKIAWLYDTFCVP